MRQHDKGISTIKGLIASTFLMVVTTSADASCIVADPSPTPLNVRTAPYGRVIGILENGRSVSIIDHASDAKSREWVYVTDPETNRPFGWVFREFIVCKGDAH